MASLLDLNKLDLQDGIYVSPQTKDFVYSDGADTEAYIGKVLAQASDLSSASAELEVKIIDWPTEYHLSGKRANLLREYNWAGVNRVLELGCGCGAITRFLGEQGMSVDAIEGSSARVKLAAQRCRDLNGIQFFCANFNDLVLPEAEYDAILLIGVAEYAQRFMPQARSGTMAVRALLTKLRKSLKPNGFIFIAIENRTGLKYVLGAHEDHYGQRFVGILSYMDEHGIRTYTKREWLEHLREAGFPEHEFSYPFPDYKVPRVILSDHLVNNSVDGFNLLESVNSRDYIFPLPNDFGITEHMFWQSLSENLSIGTFANSFCIVAHNNAKPQRLVSGFEFVHLPAFRRLEQYSVVVRKEVGSDRVTRRHFFGEVDQPRGPIRQVLHDEELLQGTLLSVQWSRTAFLQKDFHIFDSLLRKYFDFLRQEHEAGRLHIDLLPGNIMVAESGEYQPFDQEWEVDWKLTPEFVFFRALLIFAPQHKAEIARVTRAKGIYDVQDFVVHSFQVVGVDIKNSLRDMVDLEDEFQGLIAREGRQNRTRPLLDTPLTVLNIEESLQATLYWAEGKQGFNEDDSVLVDYLPTDERQQILFALPAGVSGFSRLRFDPLDERRDDHTAFFNIYEIAIRFGKDFEHSETVWRVEGEHRLAEAASKMSGMAFCDAEIGRVFVIMDHDPWIEFRLQPRRLLAEGERIFVVVTLRAKRSAEYLLAQDYYLKHADRYYRRTELLELEIKKLHEAEKELALIKSSKVWRAAEAGRGVIYNLLLPKLRAVKRKTREYRQLDRRAALHRAAGVPGRYWRMFRGLPVEPVSVPTLYENWLYKYRKEQKSRSVALGDEQPLISILMPVYNVEPELLECAIRSIRRQTYERWELCIADDCSTKRKTREYLERIKDPRIKIQFLTQNGNISAATNAAAKLATGAYFALMDNDDELEQTALFDMVAAIQASGAELIYSDEDFIRSNGHLDFPHFKPDYSPDLLLSHNYITHLVVMQQELFHKIGGFRSKHDGAQDYDLLLRAVEQTDKIFHVAKPLYHWRRTEQSTSRNPLVKPQAAQNAKAALEDCLKRRGIDGVVEETGQSHYFRVRRRIKGGPLVSIIVPYKDQAQLLETCLDSIASKTTYKNFEFVGVSNDSIAPSVFDIMRGQSKQDPRFRMVQYNVEFNFSKIVNHGVAESKGDYVLLLNNDIEIISGEWIEAMLEHAQRDDVAAVGGKLLYPDNTIQHAGIMIGLGGYAGHAHKRFPAHSPGYFNRLNVVQNVTAVTGAMMMVKRKVYEDLGGFDEEMFAVAYNDVDFCLRARALGLLNVFTPYSLAYHHESVSRGYEDTQAKRMRFAREMENLQRRHGATLAKGDPYYNVNFNQGSDNFSLRPID